MMILRGLRSSRAAVGVYVVFLALVLQGNSCRNLDRAREKVRAEIKKVLTQPENGDREWRLHWMMLEKGSVVSSFDGALTGDTETYQCEGWCVLFFLDLEPYAHYSHPTQLFVYDSKHANRLLPIQVFEATRWWPTIFEEGWAHPRSVFNTVESREDPRHVFHLDDSELPNELPIPVRRYRLVTRRGPLATSVPEGEGAESSAPSPAPTTPPAPGPSDEIGADVADCNAAAEPVWAILVNGYHDPKNSFDEDVEGMYLALKGFDVLDNRITVLSSSELPGVPGWLPASENALEKAFEDVEKAMKDCKEDLSAATPHFLLFWSSHGGDKTLFCNRNDGNQDNVTASELDGHLQLLEDVWVPDGGGDTNLAVTIVIEACESGSLGAELHNAGGHRWILTSTSAALEDSWDDIDHDVSGIPDPNPADSGSETIWGYIEAFGSASTALDTNGMVSFHEAVEYVKKTDVSFLAGEHQIGVWNSDSVQVHGSWNTSQRVDGIVSFTEPASTGTATITAPVKAKVPKGQPITIGVEIDNPGALSEKGDLALRLFRNDCRDPPDPEACDKWAPRYYENWDVNRTTVMIPGLAASGKIPLEFEVEVPDSYVVGQTMRLVVTLDSAQKIPAAGDVEPLPKSEIILEVEKKCKGICCWFKNLFN